MAIVQISKIQIRTGAESDLPQLDIGELGFATDTKNAYIGNDPLLDPPVGIEPTLTQILTDSPNCHINASQLTGVINIQVGNLKIGGGRNGFVLKTDGQGNLSWGGAGGGVAGGGDIRNSLDTQLLFNFEDEIYGDSNLVYNKITQVLTLTGNLTATNLAGNITTGAQPNITSVGSLVNLSVTGNIISANANLGNLTISNYFSGNGSLLTGILISATANTVTASSQSNITSVGTLTSLSISGVSTLGLVGNVKIGGGNPGQLLTTDGAGNLSWASPSGNANVYGNSNVASYLNSGFFNTTFIGSIPNATRANSADSANAVAGANVSGQVSNSAVAGTVYTNAQPNVTSVGTLTSLSVTGNIIGGNLITTGNVNATYLNGNGSSITGAVTNAINLVSGGTINSSVTAVTQPPNDTSTKVATTAFVQSVVIPISSIYPVGSIYTSTVNTNPFTLFGVGTWVAFGQGRVLIGDGGGFTAGATGGSADAVVVSHSHTASSTSTVTDPGHLHLIPENYETGTFQSGSGTSGAGNRKLNDRTASASTGITVSTATTVNATGVSGTNANLPPYIVVYIWNRVS